MNKLMIFIGGAVVGAAAAALFTPEKGEDLRFRIKMLLQKRGILPSDDIDEFVEMIASEIEDNEK